MTGWHQINDSISTVGYKFQALRHNIILLSNIRILSLQPIQILLTFQGSVKGEVQKVSPLLSLQVLGYTDQLNIRSDKHFVLKRTLLCVSASTLKFVTSSRQGPRVVCVLNFAGTNM